MESAMLRRAIGGTASLSAGSSQAFVSSPLVRSTLPLPLSLPGIGSSGVKFSRRRSSPPPLQKTATTTRTTTTRAALVPLPLPSEFGYVVLTAATAAVIVQWQAIEVSRQRIKAKVPYPKMYEDAEPSLFNCYQRAHHNTLETVPSFFALLAIGGLGYPVTSAAFGMLWCVGRVVYSLGYYTGDPKNRLKGMFHFFGFLGLIGTCLVLGVRQTGLLARLNF